MNRLYTIPGSCSTGLHVLLNRLGETFEVVKRDDVANYEELVPTNQVPALETEDGLLTEGASIVLYLLEKHDALPTSAEELREFRQWLLFNYATLHATYSKLFMVGVQRPVAHEESRDELIAHVSDRLSTLWSIVENRPSEREFMVGNAPPVIDYLLAIYANWNHAAPTARIEIGPRARRLIQKVVGLPEFAQAIEREGIDYRLAA